MMKKGRLQTATLLLCVIHIRPYKCTEQRPRNTEESRIVNLKPSTKNYPWMVYITQKVNEITTTPDCLTKLSVVKYSCTGSIVSAQKRILTNAHCICSYFDFPNPEIKITRYCLPNKSKDKPPTNQQTGKTVDELNYLEIFVGNKDHKRATRVNVHKAYVMRTSYGTGGHVTLRGDFDVGLIIPDPNSQTIRNLQPLELPNRNTNYDDTIVSFAGWGKVYDERADRNGKVFSTSCMTTNQGPTMGHFQPCDPKLLLTKDRNRACRTYIRPDYRPILGRCETYWNQALGILDPPQREEFKKVDIIRVLDTKTEKYTTCYRKAYFKDPGWCRLQGNLWGFCSESCKYVHKRSRDRRILRKTDTIIRSRDYCKKNPRAHRRSNNAAETCIETVYPTNVIWTFNYDESRQELTISSGPFPNPKPIPIHTKYFFIGGCQGDSGAPLWVGTINKVIVATFNGGAGTGACGAETGFPAAEVTMLTHSEINQWINRNLV